MTLHIAEVYLAQMKLGSAVSALNPYWPADTLRQVVEHSECTAFVYDATVEKLIEEIRSDLAGVKLWLRVGGPSEGSVDVLSARTYPDVVAHVNVQSFFTFGDGADPLFAHARSVGALQQELTGARVVLVLRNAECAPPGVEDFVRDVARSSGVPVYRSMEAAAVAVKAGKRSTHGTA